VETIEVYKARVHNLKNVSLTIPRNKLVVFTGVSGSGKSSLAFDTIFSEGQRRYVESLSTYARQFIGEFEKPDVEAIDGLSPAISIDQKTSSRSPRSTVGTVTEIYDFLRVLYARIGEPHCPECGVAVAGQSDAEIVRQVWGWPDDSRLQILSPVVRGRKGTYNALFQQLRKEGYNRVRIDDTVELLEELSEDYQLSRNKAHNIEVVIDRLVLRRDEATEKRLTEAIEKALKKSDGYVVVQTVGDNSKEQFFSRHMACPQGHSLGLSDGGQDEMAPRVFSFNSPYGACRTCDGLGVQYEIAEHLLIPDPKKSLSHGAIAPFEKSTGRYYQSFLKQLAKEYDLPIDVPFKQLSKSQKTLLLYGPDNVDDASSTTTSDLSQMDADDDDDWFAFVSGFDGVVNILKRRYQYGTPHTKAYIETFMHEVTCTTCHGARLKALPLSVKLGGRNIFELSELSVKDIYRVVSDLPEQLNDFQLKVGHQGLLEIQHRLRFLMDVGLGYLSLSRRSATLSGGESQRIRLATQLGAGLSGVLYVLDEPSIGLHQYNNQQLIQTLLKLRDQGNSLIVVEHDEDTIKASDWVVDIGPGAGVHGGHIVAEADPQSLLQHPVSLTGQYLSGKKHIAVPANRRTGTGQCLTIHEASRHNLKGIDVRFPLGQWITVTGLSGSGKSTLVFDLLYPILEYHFHKHKARPDGYVDITGLEHLDKFIHIDQAPIGRSSRSNPITYTGIFDDIRKVFAATEDAKVRGFNNGRFSFNTKTGQCNHCKGAGYIVQEMTFLPNAQSRCDVCDGKRYNPDTLDVYYREKNIADVLAMTVAEAVTYFEHQPKILRQMQVLSEVGLDYITLGQQATTLSGGEAQRLKLATELMRHSTGNTIYLMDEPTVGLHWEDLDKLIGILNRLVDQGNTLVVIEHNMDFIKVSDTIIDMGPEAGENGGYIVAEGSPESVAQQPDSYTGQFLKTYLA